jgi:hypothetical protein
MMDPHGTQTRTGREWFAARIEKELIQISPHSYPGQALLKTQQAQARPE